MSHPLYRYIGGGSSGFTSSTTFTEVITDAVNIEANIEGSYFGYAQGYWWCVIKKGTGFKLHKSTDMLIWTEVSCDRDSNNVSPKLAFSVNESYICVYLQISSHLYIMMDVVAGFVEIADLTLPSTAAFSYEKVLLDSNGKLHVFVRQNSPRYVYYCNNTSGSWSSWSLVGTLGIGFSFLGTAMIDSSDNWHLIGFSYSTEYVYYLKGNVSTWSEWDSVTTNPDIASIDLAINATGTSAYVLLTISNQLSTLTDHPTTNRTISARTRPSRSA